LWTIVVDQAHWGNDGACGIELGHRFTDRSTYNGQQITWGDPYGINFYRPN
jgi:hypothetical protein